MTKKLAADWAPHGIRVNAVAAGFFPHEASVSGSREEGVEPLQNMIPAGRTGSIWEFGWLSAMTCTPLFGAMTGPNWRAFWKTDRKSVVSGKSVSVRVDLGGRRSIKKTKKQLQARNEHV